MKDARFEKEGEKKNRIHQRRHSEFYKSAHNVRGVIEEHMLPRLIYDIKTMKPQTNERDNRCSLATQWCSLKEKKKRVLVFLSKVID